MKTKDEILQEVVAIPTIISATSLTTVPIHIRAREWLEKYLRQYPALGDVAK